MSRRILMKKLAASWLWALWMPSVATASEAAVKLAMQKRYPDIPVESVARTPIAGLYEVFTGGEVLYVDEKASYLIVRGRLIDAASGKDLTEERVRVLTRIKFDQLPLDLAFRKVLGSGARKLAYFTDPNCPYCRKIEPDLAKLENVTIYTFLYPVLGQDSTEKSKAVWCSKDRVKAWDDLMLSRVAPKAAGTCDTPIEKILAYGRQRGINGTPTLIFADGLRVGGAIPYDELKRLLEGAR